MTFTWLVTATLPHWLAAEARQGYEQGHRAFKIKVGRGARHLPLEQGTQRDIAVVRAVRAVAGAGAPVMVDANNGYNLNLTKRVLLETADCRIHWLEEPFHEDAVLYRDLREWMTKEGLAVLIADGEGEASPRLLDWAREGLVDVVQYDIISWGFTRWLALARQLADWGARSAPHNYGNGFGNYASATWPPPAPTSRSSNGTRWPSTGSTRRDTPSLTASQPSLPRRALGSRSTRRTSPAAYATAASAWPYSAFASALTGQVRNGIIHEPSEHWAAAPGWPGVACTEPP